MDLDRRTVLGLAAGVATVGVAGAARAQAGVHTLKVGDPLERFAWLKPGVRVYLRSQQKGEQHSPADIWRRETRIETIDGVQRLRIVQRWDGGGATPTLAERDSVFELGTFRPLSHIRISTRDGTRMVEGFRFTGEGVVGLPDLAGNMHAGLSVPFDEPMFNFETDLEMLQTLPLAAGYSVSIPFFHPGPTSKPARYLWSVTGDETLMGPDGRGIDCWIVQTDYNAPPRPPARFGLAKAGQQLIRQEAATPDGTVHRKLLLPL